MRSMTGYGKAEYSLNGITIVVEVKSVNNRVFDFNARMPRAFMPFEDSVRKTVQNYISRGRVDLFVIFSDLRETTSAVNLNLSKAKAYFNAAEEIASSLNIKNDLTPASLLRFPEVIDDKISTDYSEFSTPLLETVELALKSFNKMREEEGARLITDMLSRVDLIKDLRDKIALKAPQVVLNYKEKLTARITEALKDVNFDQSRLLTEVAFFTDKANIDEELTRLSSHIEQFKKIVSTLGSGKKLDFLMQEFNRETNTICSKCNEIEITDYALSMKNEIEKIREQVQNLE
ncbi:MAG: YicC family protein [Clostridia bacterium]|nr:YicC family protein [Clostridia bacterium]